MRKQKYVIARKVMPIFFNWPIHLKDIQCIIRKADIIPLPILLLDKTKISKTINILHCLVERLGLKGVVEDKVVLIKVNYLTARNVTCALYQKQSEPNQLMGFSWAKPIVGLFQLQINVLRLFYITFWGKSKDYYSLQ